MIIEMLLHRDARFHMARELLSQGIDKSMMTSISLYLCLHSKGHEYHFEQGRDGGCLLNVGSIGFKGQYVEIDFL